MQNTQKNLN